MYEQLSPAGQLVSDQLDEADAIARRKFKDPSEAAVMAVFDRLCVETDLMAPDEAPEAIGDDERKQLH